jgi:hypothetical protein
MNKINWLIRIALGLQLLGGFLFLSWLIIWAGPISVGTGRLTGLLHDLEVYDFKLWLIIGTFLYLLLLAGMLVLVFLINISNRKLEDIKLAVVNLLQGKFIPVTVDIDETIPVAMGTQVEAPFEISTKISFNEEVFVKTTIPVDMNIPLDTVVETSVMGLGKIKIPIKASMPMKFNFDFSGPVKMNVQQFDFHLKEKARVEMPPLQVPIKCSIKARLNLESNFTQFLNSRF